MGKMSLAGASVVAAIPGALLAYLMLMAVLNSFEPMPMILKVAAILVLVTAATMALFPAYVLIWYRDQKSAAKSSPASQDEQAAPVHGDQMVEEESAAFGDEELGDDTQDYSDLEVADADELEELDTNEEDFEDDVFEGEEFEDDEFEAVADDSSFDEEMNVELDESFQLDDEDDFEFEDFEELDDDK